MSCSATNSAMRVIFLTICIFVFTDMSFGQKADVSVPIPDDLTIILDNTGTIEFAEYTRYKISADGTVRVEITNQGLPAIKPMDVLLRGKEPYFTKNDDRSKTVAEKGKEKQIKLSRIKLIELFNLAKSIEFFNMADSYHGNHELAEVTCVNHALAKQITITAHGRTKSVYFFLGCSYGDFDPLIRFNRLFDEISKMISEERADKVLR